MNNYICDCGESFDSKAHYGGHKRHCEFELGIAPEDYINLDREARLNILFKVVRVKASEGEVGVEVKEVVDAVGDGSWSNGKAYMKLYNDINSSDRIWSEEITVDFESDRKKKKWFASELNEEWAKIELIRRLVGDVSGNKDLEAELRGKLDNLAYMVESIVDWEIQTEKRWKIHPSKRDGK